MVQPDDKPARRDGSGSDPELGHVVDRIGGQGFQGLRECHAQGDLDLGKGGSVGTPGRTRSVYVLSDPGSVALDQMPEMPPVL